MKVKEIFYSKKFNLGNYEMEEIGIVLIPDEGEKAADVVKKAKSFVEQNRTKKCTSTNTTNRSSSESPKS